MTFTVEQLKEKILQKRLIHKLNITGYLKQQQNTTKEKHETTKTTFFRIHKFIQNSTNI